jgi:hypothetical protein
MGYNAKSRIWQLIISEALGMIMIVLLYFFILFSLAEGINVDMYTSQALYVKSEMTGFFQMHLPFLSAVIAVEMGILCAFFGFFHLYYPVQFRQTRSLPIKKSRMFWAIYWNGLLIWLLPALFNTLLLIALTFSFFYGMPLVLLFAMMKALLISLCVFCLIYHFSLLFIMLSGNVFSALLSLAVFGLFHVAA